MPMALIRSCNTDRLWAQRTRAVFRVFLHMGLLIQSSAQNAEVLKGVLKPLKRSSKIPQIARTSKNTRRASTSNRQSATTMKNLPINPVQCKSINSTRPRYLEMYNGLGLQDNAHVLFASNLYSNLEPPDVAICAGLGLVLQVVNSVVAIYNSTSGRRLRGPGDLSTLMGFSYGQVTLPRCLYEPYLGQFYISVSAVDEDRKWYIGIAASNNEQLLSSVWQVYHIPIGNRPNVDVITTSFAQNQFGLYVTTNAYNNNGDLSPDSLKVFQGASIYAIDKTSMQYTSTPVSYWTYRNITYVSKDGRVKSKLVNLQGATTQMGSRDYYENGNNVQFFVSRPGAIGAGSTCLPEGSGIYLTSLSETNKIRTAPPVLTVAAPVDGLPLQCPSEAPQRIVTFWTIKGGDNRLGPTAYSNGLIYTTANTLLTTASRREPVNGIAYFILKPAYNNTRDLTLLVKRQGLLAACGDNHALYPSVAVDSNGQGLIAFTLVGSSFYPSLAYAPLSLSKGVGTIVIASLGRAPYFGHYWGDYTAATLDEKSNFWFSGPWIREVNGDYEGMFDFQWRTAIGTMPAGTILL